MHPGKGIFDISGHTFNEFPRKCLNLLARYVENSVQTFKKSIHYLNFSKKYTLAPLLVKN